LSELGWLSLLVLGNFVGHMLHAFGAVCVLGFWSMHLKSSD
jgi:hypothetical protein